MKTKPVLILIAGPNGSGKTTITEQLRRHAWMDGCVCVNPDIIAEEKYGGWNSPAASLKAAQEAERIRKDCFAKRENLAFETVFSAPDKLRFVRAAVKVGYFVRLFFICTESPEINASRILGRRLEGGHDVPLEKIYSRFANRLPKAPLLFDGLTARTSTITPSTMRPRCSFFARRTDSWSNDMQRRWIG